jgi:hypothetical protein
MQVNLTPAQAARFWAKVQRRGPTDCWPWVGTKNHHGYGRPYDPRTGRLIRAHRVIWELTFGPIPDGRVVLHTCDNPPCCNPAHLRLGTQLDNIADRNRKRRTARGERASHARLTADQVRAIRWRHTFGITMRALAAEYGVSSHQIYLIVHRKSWAHLD